MLRLRLACSLSTLLLIPKQNPIPTNLTPLSLPHQLESFFSLIFVDFTNTRKKGFPTAPIKTHFSNNLLNLVDHFNNRGLYRSIFLSIMEDYSIPSDAR
nr:putative isoprenylcysteine alpha-carbonyl methylesterase icmel1 [Quercus suber]